MHINIYICSHRVSFFCVTERGSPKRRLPGNKNFFSVRGNPISTGEPCVHQPLLYFRSFYTLGVRSHTLLQRKRARL